MMIPGYPGNGPGYVEHCNSLRKRTNALNLTLIWPNCTNAFSNPRGY